MPGLVLAIDIGNTTTVLGVFRGSRLLLSSRFVSGLDLTSGQCNDLFDLFLEKRSFESTQVKRAVIASVVPRLTTVYTNAVEQKFGIRPIHVSAELPLGLKIDYRRPEQ